MTERNDFVKIRVHLLIDPNIHYTSENGRLKFNPHHLDDFYDVDAKWREPIQTFINDEVGLHNWAIRFQPFFTGEYEVYVYCEGNEEFRKIVGIIQDRIRDINFRLFTRKGTIEEYIAGR